MASRKPLRLAPSRDGVRVAGTWRVWSSGDEFYAAARETIHATKASFHRNKNWQVRIGDATTRLVTTKKIRSEWLYALSVQWVIFPDVLTPDATSEEQVELIEVPEDYKLALNLWVSEHEAEKAPDLPPEGGAVIWQQQLRSGKLLVAHAVTLPLMEQDKAGAMSALHQAPVITYDKIPEDAYAELAWLSARPEHGNLVVVLPLTPSVLREGKASTG